MPSITILRPLTLSFFGIRGFSFILLLIPCLSACQKKEPPSSPNSTNLIYSHTLSFSNSTPEESALSYYVKGICAEANNDLSSALSFYTLAFEKDPSYQELGPFLVQQYFKLGKPAQALKPLQKLIELQPNNSEWYTQRGLAYYLQNQNSLAYQSFQAALQLNPTNFSTYALLYQLIATNSPTFALNFLQNTTPQFSHESLFWQSIGEAYANFLIDQKNLNSSQVAKKTLPLFQRALDLSPTNLPLLLRLAELNELATNYLQALTLYKKAVGLSTNQEPIQARLAAAYLNAKDKEKAIQTLEAVLHKKPKNPMLSLTLANLCYQIGNTNKMLTYLTQAESQGISPQLLGDFSMQIKNRPLAETYLKKVLQKSDAESGEWIQLANVFSRQNKNQEALETMQQAQKKFPSTPEIFLMSSFLARQMQQFQKASNLLYQAEQIAANSTHNLSQDEIPYQWAIFYEQTGDLAKSETYFKKAIALNPKNHEAMNYLSYMLAQHNRKLDEALTLINQALNFEPQNPAYLDTLGWIYFQQGQYEKALTPIEHAFELSSYDGEIGEHLGEIFIKMNQTNKALETWQKALQSNPQRESLKEKIQFLKRN